MNETNFLTRMYAEIQEVRPRVEALQNFLQGESPEKMQLELREIADLHEQLHHMESYLWILQRRYRRLSTLEDAAEKETDRHRQLSFLVP